MSWLTRLKNAVSPRRLDADLADELRDHLDRRAADLERRGLTPSDAQRHAALAFGNITAIQETTRELRLSTVLEGTLQDVRYAWRGLLRNPVFAATAILSLGLAIGANTALYSIADAALLRPLPVPQPDRLVVLATPETAQPGLPASSEDSRFSYPLYEQLRDAAAPAARLALFDSPARVEAQAGSADAPYEDVIQQYVSPDAFEVLNVGPASGSLLSPREDRYPGPRPVVVLSYQYWSRRFAADPSVIGTRLIVNGRTYSVLGVAAKGFTGTEPGKFVDVWLPITLTDPGVFTQPAFRPFHLLGRLAPAATAEQLAARLQPAFHRHQESRAAQDAAMPPALQQRLRDMTLLVRSGAAGVSEFRRTFSRPLWILLGVSLCILLIACANVASLLLARSSTRAAELALRISLGARRARLVRQLLTEGMLLSSLAGLCGWASACIAAPALLNMVSDRANPIRLDLALDSRALAFCAIVCALSALFFSLLPALQATAAAPMFAIRQAGGQTARLRLGRLFVAVQVAFAFCLVTGGAGFLISLRNLTSVETGFDPQGVTVLTISNTRQRDRQLPLLHQMQSRIAALPGVQSAATAWMPVFSGARRAQRVLLPGKALSANEATFYRVSPNYFATLRTPLLAGRDLSLPDNDDEPVPTVVNRAFARRYFNSDSVLGREFRRDDGVRHQIVGLAANSHFGDLRAGPEPIAYMPMKPPLGYTLYVRSTLDAATVGKLVEREAQALGLGVRLRDITLLETLVDSTILKERLLAGIGGASAFLGLILAAVGLFGLLNYSVTRRTREIGIRAALGASRSSLYALVLKDLSGMVAGGLVAGLAASLVLMRVARTLFFGIRPGDPLVLAIALAVFLTAALIAAGIPAYRAASIDPLLAVKLDG